MIGDSRIPHQKSSDAAFRRHYGEYRLGARRRGLFFELTFEQFKSIVKRNCHYCGTAPRERCSRTAALPQCMNGVDRVKNSHGYTLDNTVPCCTICNNAKWTMNYEDFIAWARRVVMFANVRQIAGE